MDKLLTKSFRAAVFGSALGLASVQVAQADGLAAATSEILLTVRGGIENTNAESAAVFDMALLETLAQTTFTTTTIWTEGPQTFTGVELSVLLEALDAEGSVIRATALNDYAIEIPVSDAVTGGPIVAYLQNGEPMAVREKGPLWIVYPYDSSPDYQTEQVYSRSIWQLASIDVLP